MQTNHLALMIRASARTHAAKTAMRAVVMPMAARHSSISWAWSELGSSAFVPCGTPVATSNVASESSNPLTSC